MQVVRRGATVVALVLAVGPVRPDEPPSVEKLVELLGSPSFPARERATRQLKERGPAALPALRKALESRDEEVRKRAELLVPPLEIEEALLPRRVTLKTDSSLAAVEAINKQTGYKIGQQGKIAVNLKEPLNLTDAPFWEAMDALGKATGTAPYFETYQKTLHLQTTTARSPFVNVRGPFRLEAVWFHEDRDVDLTRLTTGSDGRRPHRLTLAVNLLAEPRITFLKVHPARVEEAVDSDGKSLVDPTAVPPPAPPTEPGRPQPPRTPDDPAVGPPGRGTFRGESLTSSDVRLRRASETARTARVIRGTIPVRAVLIRKPMVVGGKLQDAAGKSVRSGNESLVITGVQNQGGNNVEVRVQVPRQADDPYREWHDRFKVTDEAGNEYQMNGRGTSSDGRTYSISMYFAPPWNKKGFGPPARLVFDDWVVHEHAIPFEFRDVPLP